ncbi:transporter substrate-binding domain-containing protein [Halobacteriovorax sp.]|uniref:transporter substrate-binding domain-containing protein n=1 Tax=Halobacteriovorax sp. TaxID=2020862 RepID=UPI003563BF02
MVHLLLPILFFFLLESTSAKSYKCGTAEGYAPYQYIQDGKESGLDLEIVKEFNKIGPHQISVRSGEWDSLVSELFHTSGVDCLIGMEKTKSREANFVFSKTVYKRESSLVLLQSSTINKLNSFNGEFVCGDKNSSLESYLVGQEEAKVRLIYMESKEKCMIALKNGSISAAIMPVKVSKYLSKKMNIKLKSLINGQFSSNVGFAFKVNKKNDLNSFNKQLLKLIKKKSFKQLLKKY